jgi:hypothetical protein
MMCGCCCGWAGAQFIMQALLSIAPSCCLPCRHPHHCHPTWHAVAPQVTTSSEGLSAVYAVLGRRRCRILREEMREGSDLFTVHAYLPAEASFGFADELRRRSSGAATASLLLSHWERLQVSCCGGGARSGFAFLTYKLCMPADRAACACHLSCHWCSVIWPHPCQKLSCVHIAGGPFLCAPH